MRRRQCGLLGGASRTEGRLVEQRAACSRRRFSNRSDRCLSDSLDAAGLRLGSVSIDYATALGSSLGAIESGPIRTGAELCLATKTIVLPMMGQSANSITGFAPRSSLGECSLSKVMCKLNLALSVWFATLGRFYFFAVIHPGQCN